MCAQGAQGPPATAPKEGPMTDTSSRTAAKPARTTSPFLRRASSGAEHRRHEDDRRFLRRRPGHAARPCHEGAAGARHRTGQPRQPAFRGGPALLLRHGPRRPAGVLRDAQGQEETGRPQRARRDAARLVPVSPEANGASAHGSRQQRCPTTARWKSCPASSRSHVRPERHPAGVVLQPSNGEGEPASCRR